MKISKPGLFMYYDYLFWYVNDVICISDYPICSMKYIQSKLKLKGKKKKYFMYLGSALSNMNNNDSQKIWTIYYDKYCAVVVTVVEYVSGKARFNVVFKVFYPSKM